MHDYLNDHQKKCVLALEELKKICDKHGIEYFLLAGSTLGGVRHEGMIPWDDDIDIGLRYPHWKKIMEILPEELPEDFRYIDNIVSPDFPRHYGKILEGTEPCIDLFLLPEWDPHIISGGFRFRLHREYDAMYFRLLGSKKHPGYIMSLKTVCFRILEKLRDVCYLLMKKHLTVDSIKKKVMKNVLHYEGKHTGYYVNIFSIYSMKKELIPTDMLDHPSEVLFEGNSYPTVGDTDSYLKNLYGDYMKLPPEKEQFAAHAHLHFS